MPLPASPRPTDDALVRLLVGRHLGREPERVERARQGHAARVYRAKVRERDVVVKLYDGTERARWFAVVAPTLARLHAAGRPVPLLRGHGATRCGRAFVLYDHVPGVCADGCGVARRALWEEVGRHVAAANSLPAEGFGRPRFGDADSPALFRTWREFAGPELGRLTSPTLSRDLPAYDDALRAKVRDRLLPLLAWEFEPRVVHGNVSGSNVVVDERSGELRGIIDWDAMIFARAPHFELATALLWMDEEASAGFLAGYGMTAEAYEEIREAVETARLFYLAGYLVWHLVTGNETMATATRSAMEEIVG